MGGGGGRVLIVCALCGYFSFYFFYFFSFFFFLGGGGGCICIILIDKLSWIFRIFFKNIFFYFSIFLVSKRDTENIIYTEMTVADPEGVQGVRLKPPGPPPPPMKLK